MADPNLSQAAWDFRWERHAVIVAGMWRPIRELRRHFLEEVVNVYNDIDKNSNIANGSITLTGVNLGVNTSPEGFLYVRMVANASNWDVHLYKATGGGGGDEVAQSINVADGAVATLSAVNSSGLGGSLTLGGTVTAEADDVHKLVVLPGAQVQINATYDGDIDRDRQMERLLLDLAQDIGNQLRNVEQRALAAYQAFVAQQLGPTVKSGSLDPLVMLNRVVTDDDGAKTVAFSGALEDLRLAMKNNAAAATPQEVVKAVLSVGAVAYESGNVGAGTTPTPTVYEHQEGGTWTMLCTDATIGRQLFQMKFAPSDASRAQLTYTSPQPLQVKKEWKDPGPLPSRGRPRIGVKSLTIDYVRTITNVSGTPLSTTATDWSETGESADNTDDGKLYVDIDANGSNWDVNFYSDSNRTVLVAKATNIAGSASFTATERNGSGLTVFGKLAASPTGTDTATVDLNVFKTDQRTDGDPDRAEFTVTETSIGSNQLFFAEGFGYYANSDTAGGETVDEYYGTRGSTALVVQNG